MTLAPVPAAWQALIPKAGASSALAADLEFAPRAPIHELRARLESTCKNKRGDGWHALRRAARGERLFRLVDGPGDPGLPVVSGVDDFISRGILWPLAGAVDPESGTLWHLTAPEDIAALLDPSLGHLRADCRTLGHESKFTREHVAAKWIPAAQKRAAEHASALAFVDRLTQGTSEAERHAAQGLPLLLQLDGAYFVLDDREPQIRAPIYQGPVGSMAVVALARQLWDAQARPLDVPKPTGIGTRAMSAAEAVQTYGRSVTQVVTDLAAAAPRVDDLTLIKPAIVNHNVTLPVHDPDVADWLELVAGSPGLHDLLLAWIAWAAPPKLAGVTPALVLVGAPDTGKSLFAQGIARAGGTDGCAPLSQALQKFAGVIATNPYVFSDEGLPRGSHGQPMTEEFRELATKSQHVIEQKGMNARQPVRGGVRIMLAANRTDRLFANRGNLDGNDVAALIRRLIVIDVSSKGSPRALELSRRARALGAHENDPRRLERVAAHMRWIQVTRTDAPEPRPYAGELHGALRSGSDAAQAALLALDEAHAGGADWVTLDPEAYAGAPDGVAWVRPDALAQRAATAPGPLLRAIAAYIVRAPVRMRRHPVTGVALEAGAGRSRWLGLDLGALRLDGYLGA